MGTCTFTPMHFSQQHRQNAAMSRKRTTARCFRLCDPFRLFGVITLATIGLFILQAAAIARIHGSREQSSPNWRVAHGGVNAPVPAASTDETPRNPGKGDRYLKDTSLHLNESSQLRAAPAESSEAMDVGVKANPKDSTVGRPDSSTAQTETKANKNTKKTFDAQVAPKQRKDNDSTAQTKADTYKNAEKTIAALKELRQRGNTPARLQPLNITKDQQEKLKKEAREALNKRKGVYRGYGPVMCLEYNHTFLKPEHGCQHKKNTHLMHCQFNDLRIDTERMHGDMGGEILETVMGREEEREFFQYDSGAFSLVSEPDLRETSTNGDKNFYLEEVFSALDYPSHSQQNDQEQNCTETWTGTTLLITRYEYANLYHTMTDWWNTFFSIPKDAERPIRIIFLDAHAQGNLDSVWSHVISANNQTNTNGGAIANAKTIVSEESNGEINQGSDKSSYRPVSFARHLTPGGICLKRAIFVPAGYTAPIFLHAINRCQDTNVAEEFVSHMISSYGLGSVKMQRGKVVIIDRIAYVSHPRSKPKEALRLLANMNELHDHLENQTKATSVQIVQLETMTMEEQIRTIREAHVLIGNHGAGLTHLLWLHHESHLIELAQGAAGYFSKLSKWRGLASYKRLKATREKLSASDLNSIALQVDKVLSE